MKIILKLIYLLSFIAMIACAVIFIWTFNVLYLKILGTAFIAFRTVTIFSGND